MKLGMKLKSRNEMASPLISIGIALFIMFVVSGLLLVLLAFLLYKFDLGESVIRGGIIGVYVISGFIGGLILGKRMKNRKYMWGLVGGLLYFLILFVFSILMKQGMNFDTTKVVTSLILCGASGMTGGMIS